MFTPNENPLDWFKDILSSNEFIEEETDTIEFINPISIDIGNDSISDVKSISFNEILNTITINSNIFLESQKVYQVKGEIQSIYEYIMSFIDSYESGDILVLTSYLINKY
jgi:F0F1-type ATP synthase membrane subunit a